MGGVVAPALGALSGGGMGGIFTSILGQVVSSIMAPDEPSPQAPPPPPAPVAEPVAPTPVVSEVKSEQPVLDTEAARVRATKRRKSAEDRKLFSLSEEDSAANILTKSILGD